MRLGDLTPVSHGQKPRLQLGTLLVEKGLITEAQLGEALAERNVHGGLLGETLVRLGFVFEDELARALAEQAGVPFVNLEANPVDRYAVGTLPRSLGEALPALPVRFTPEGGLVIAAASSIRNSWRNAPAAA